VNPTSPVWITGTGAATPLGNSFADIAGNLLAGRSGVRAVTSFDASQHPSRIGGQIDRIPCPLGRDETAFRVLTPIEQLLIWTTSAALRDAGLWESRGNLRLGVVMGIGAEWLLRWEEHSNIPESAVFHPARDAQSLVRKTCNALELPGPAISLSAACASGNYALAQARQWLRMGWVDVCVAGACDMVLTPLSMAGFGNLRALSRRNDEPALASRPFDKDRDGFVMGEGGAVFVLESAERARQRGAKVYGEVAGCGASSDAYNMVIPSPHPEPATAAMKAALADARANPADVDYLNAHATGTPVGDIAEARVLEAVFGTALPQVPVSSTKSMTGHLLTAAAAFEAVACLVALQQKALPPTINLDQPDPECALRHVPNQAEERRVRVAVSNSFGFGGSNTCLLLRAA
jgi:3-oxoacyl-[acyl-carrier-protein] synthase II